ncbi:MAG: hypothetical protein IT441_07780 [Phycisphaeraceae bacterium]|nr:hypothetical protein [Phycisphaeraceae bacterium]
MTLRLLPTRPWQTVLLMLLFIAGCRHASPVVMRDGQPVLRPMSRQERAGDLAYAAPFPPYAAAPTEGKGRVFLVALGSNIANFAQEVVYQRRAWLDAGFKPEEVICYYVKPKKSDYLNDRGQFDTLSPQLAGFYIAEPSLIRRHLLEAAEQKPQAVYLYFTSHGSYPHSLGMPPSMRESPKKAFVIDQHPGFDDYWLVTDAAEAGTVDTLMKLHAEEAGADPADLFLTPAVLRQWLLVFPEPTRKVVVLQGCYSGGFVHRDPDFVSADMTTLEGVPNLIAITASRHDRPSFGCGPGQDQTVFGELWNKELAASLAKSPEVDWASLYQAVRKAVNETEIERDMPVMYRSWPMMLATPAATQPSK